MSSGPSVARGESVLFVGESHTLSFAENIVSRGDAPPLMCHSIFIGSAVSLANVTSPSGALCAPVRNALRAARLLVDRDDPADDTVESVYQTKDLGWRGVARRRFSVAPLIVLCLGSYDIFRAIVDFPADDFAFPAERIPHRLAGPFASKLLPGALDASTAADWFAGRVEPFRRALARLRELGFGRLAFLAIPPPTLDDARAAAVISSLRGDVSGPKLRTAFRYKAAMLLNALAAHACAQEGAAFLDSWPLLTHDGLVGPGVLADSSHLSEAAVREVLVQLVVPAANFIAAA